MKKIILLISLLFCFLSVKAQSDTTIVKQPIRFETEQIVSKTGKEYTKYYVLLNGTYYESNKSSMERYYTILRFKGQPCVAVITTGKTKKQKIIVL